MASIHAQESADSLENRLQILHMDKLISNFLTENQLDSLSGNVVLFQDSVYMYCDTALIINQIDVEAYGDVSILQSDSLRIFCDTLYFRGNQNQTKLKGRVLMEKGDSKLSTSSMLYDLDTKISSFNHKVSLKKNTATISSDRGKFDVKADRGYFYSNVEVDDEGFKLFSDTLLYFNDIDKAVFHGNSHIIQDSAHIYCDSGVYFIQEKNAHFKNNVKYEKGEKRATANEMKYDGATKTVTLTGQAKFYESEDKFARADEIVYDENTEIASLNGHAFYQDAQQEVTADVLKYNFITEAFETSGRSTVTQNDDLLTADKIFTVDSTGQNIATGNVVVKDTVQQHILYCETLSTEKNTNSSKAYGQEKMPMISTEMDSDTLYIVADTLHQYVENDTSEFLHAYENVRVIKDNLKLFSDDLLYTKSDSVFLLTGSPIIWADSIQITGDTMYIQLKNKSIAYIDVIQNGFIVTDNADELYDQVKGRDIRISFENDTIQKMDVQGNAESIYFAKDENEAYIGLNQTVCSRIWFLFEGGEIRYIKSLTNAKSSMTPMKKIKSDQLRLEGFYLDNRKRDFDFLEIREILALQ